MESIPATVTRPWWKSALAYALMILGTLLAFVLIRLYGETLVASQVAENTTIAKGAQAGGHLLFHILLALTAVVLLGRILAHSFA